MLVDAFEQIVNEMGATHWSFNADLCEMEMGGISQAPPPSSDGYVECNCNSNNNTVCHVTAMYGLSLLSFIIIRPLFYIFFLFHGCSSEILFVFYLFSYIMDLILQENDLCHNVFIYVFQLNAV